MKKDEAEKAIRSLATTWFDTLPEDKREHPSWYAFKDWLFAHYSHCLDFRSRTGANYDAEAWFDDELGQNWRR
ncbi:hypothetical protein [Bradyrhizobium sp. SHOUNA76]|uniref:hypothetical protein n=1 Tax=Bradyrhizobium sp. SHOUNA76 TaxID=2908927 RepID=UPI001FF485AE|nr:hypothetical protein [Bradyrhizobium sp. SHOUNA76]MCJ9700182.1 hypothetical protein [Bradyrhizobium sp. SHOUNA76]